MKSYCTATLMQPRYIVCLALMALMGCGSDKGLTVHFVLPDSYVGTFELILDQKGGTNVKRHGDIFTYFIPEGGQLKVASVRPLEKWHNCTAAYKTKDSIPVYPYAAISTNQIALFELGVRASGDVYTVVGFVGTKTDADRLMF